MSNWINFIEGTPNARTLTWNVVAKEGVATLGRVAWFGRWRRYCFFPSVETVFEQDCLRSIASFCEDQTRRHKELRSVEKVKA